ITQVSGRAGRHDLEGAVVVHTYTPDHYSIDLASIYDYEQIFTKEMQLRKTFLYPPSMFMALTIITHPNAWQVNEVEQQIRKLIADRFIGKSFISGPSPSPMARIKNRYRYQLMIKYRDEPQIHDIMIEMQEAFKVELNQDVQILIDFNPQHIM